MNNMENYTQVGVEISTKNRLDTFKANYKNDILSHFKRKKRLITNSLAVEYLLDKHERMSGSKKGVSR